MQTVIENPTKCPVCGNRLVKTSKHFKTCITCPSAPLYPIPPQRAEKCFIDITGLDEAIRKSLEM